MKHDKRRAHFGRICARCGCDEWGFHWPNCATLAAGTRGWPIHAAVRRTMHELSCARYWPDDDMWTCVECDAAMAKEE